MPNAEEQIRRAIEEGKFDNLPGKGKPLHLEQNPFEDPEWRLANHVLKSSGFTLPWIESRQEILAGIDAARTALKNAWLWREKSYADHQPGTMVEAEWKRALTAFSEQISTINKKILSFNLEAPSAQFQLVPLNLEHEIASLTGVTG